MAAGTTRPGPGAGAAQASRGTTGNMIGPGCKGHGGLPGADSEVTVRNCRPSHESGLGPGPRRAGPGRQDRDCQCHGDDYISKFNLKLLR